MPDTDDEKFNETCKFIIKLGVAAHGYGPSAERLERLLIRITETFGYHGIFHSTPSEMMFAFWREDETWQHTHFESLNAGSYNMAKLSMVGELIISVEEENFSLKKALKQLKIIEETPNPWGVIATGISFTLVGFGFAGLMGGGLWDVIFGASLSFLIYLFMLYSDKIGGRLAESLPFTSAFIAGIIATVIKYYFPEVNIGLLTLSGIIILIPGFTVSAGIVEMVTNHIISGTANLMSGLVYLMKQFSGAWLGIGTASLLFPITVSSVPHILNIYEKWGFLCVLFLGLVIAYQTLKKDFIWVLGGCVLTYIGVMLGSEIYSTFSGTLLGAAVAGLLANIWASKTMRPTSIMLVPSITVLVSGSIGFRGLLNAAAGQTGQGIEQFLQMFIVALTIAAGLLVANTIIRPKITL